MISALISFLIVAAILYGMVNLITMGEAHRYLMKNRPETLRPTAKSKLSWPARQLVKEFRALPKDWRPDGVDILSIVQALDVKYGREAVDNHFCDYVYGNFKWDTYSGKDRAHCNHTSNQGYYQKECPGLEYISLHREFKEINASLARQEARIRNIAIAGDLDALAALRERMAEYRGIIDETNTKELS